ncbi:MAG: hypothetical protein WB947_00840 [Thermoplasmata archaeon]
MVVLASSFSALAEEGAQDSSGTVAPDLEERLRRSLQAATARLAPQKVGLLEWRPEDDSGLELSDVIPVLERLRGEGWFSATSLRLSEGEAPRERSPAGSPQGRLYSGELSLLDHRRLSALGGSAESGALGFFALDPFSRGRLDGSRFAGSVGERRPDAPPVSVRELRREFLPVVALDFLTTGRRRTLAQASLQFLYRWPWLCSAFVPLPSPERLDELVGAEFTPPLTEDDVERVVGAR